VDSTLSGVLIASLTSDSDISRHFMRLLAWRNRSHSLAADRLLQGFNRGQIAPKCVFPTDYALKPEKGCWLSGGKVNNYGVACVLNNHVGTSV